LTTNVGCHQLSVAREELSLQGTIRARESQSVLVSAQKTFLTAPKRSLAVVQEQTPESSLQRQNSPRTKGSRLKALISGPQSTAFKIPLIPITNAETIRPTVIHAFTEVPKSSPMIVGESESYWSESSGPEVEESANVTEADLAAPRNAMAGPQQRLLFKPYEMNAENSRTIDSHRLMALTDSW
jgi:hypothetical protein